MAGFMDYFTGGGSGGGGFDMFSSDASGMGDLLTAKQQEAIKRQSMMAMAAQLLQAGGRSTQRTSLGQAVGQGLVAGQQAQQAGTTGAVNQLLMRSKLNEATRAQTQAETMRKLLMGEDGGGAAAASPEMQAINAPAATGGALGPTMQRAAMIPQLAQAGMPAAGMPAAGMPAAGMPAGGAFSFLSPQQRAIMSGMKPDDQSKAMLDAMAGQRKFGAPMTFMRGGQPVMAQQNESGEERVMAGASPYEALPADVRSLEYVRGTPLAGTGESGISAIKGYRASGAPKTIVDMVGGQKGFENEMKLGAAFKQEPIYRDFSDMKSSFSQVIAALGQNTPIGDVAGATKVMKLLDPGSVVRESELGLAMAAGGRMDRLQSYFSNMMTGQKLTAIQRDDFQRLSSELFAAAGQAYNEKRSEYQQFGDAYKFNNLGVALGKPATIPSIMKAPPRAGAQRPQDINDILNSYRRP
jgi:hypothetical protein